MNEHVLPLEACVSCTLGRPHLRGAPKPWASRRTRPEAEAYLHEIFPNGFLRGRWAKQRFPGYLLPSKVLVVKGKMVK